VLTNRDIAVAIVAAPRKEEEVVPTEAVAAEAGEPEVIGKKKEEGEEEGKTAEGAGEKGKEKGKEKEPAKEAEKEKGKEKKK
jgi:hypothetical protein